MESIKIQKKKFLRHIYAYESVTSAVKTRNEKFPIYKSGINGKDRNLIKVYLRSYLLDLWADIESVTKEEMLDSILDLKENCTSNFSHLLHEGCFRLGISQKMICLYTKFLWVNGDLKSPPPLIPYDGIVKGLLKNENLKDWTTLDEMDDYERVISEILLKSNGNPAEWELTNWNATKNSSTFKE